ncbi:MAG: TPR end-of-group domain-containing protein, partial [Candidatus Acidiferrales bacterium]
ATNQYGAARNFALMGKKDEALALLQKAFDARSGGMVYIKAEPFFDSIRSDPGFQALIKKMNYPQ